MEIRKMTLRRIWNNYQQGYRVFDKYGTKLNANHLFYWQHDERTTLDVSFNPMRKELRLPIVVGAK